MSNEYLNIAGSLQNLKIGSNKQLYKPISKQHNEVKLNDVRYIVKKETCEELVSEVNKTSETEGKAEWFTLGVVFLSNLLLGWTFVVFSVLYVYFVEYYESSKATCGWIGSIQMGVAQTFGLLVSPLLILYGCRLVSLVGSFTVTITLAVSAFAHKLWILFFTFGIITGIGLSMMYLCNAVVIQQRFNKNRALAAGIALTGLSVGNAMGPVVKYLQDIYGWRGALLIHSGVTAHAVVLSALLHPPWLSYRQVAQKYELIHDSKNPMQDKVTISSFLFHLCDFSVLKYRPFALFCFAYLLMMINSNAFWNHVSGRAIFYGLSYTQGPVLITVLALGALVSRILFSLISNCKCVNKVLLFSIGTCCGGVSSFLLTSCYSFSLMAVVNVVFGIHLGSTVTVVSVCAVFLVGRDRIARAQGFLNFAYGTAAVTATPLSGWIFDVTHDYNMPFYVTGTMAVVGTGLALLSFLEASKKSCCSRLDHS